MICPSCNRDMSEIEPEGWRCDYCREVWQPRLKEKSLQKERTKAEQLVASILLNWGTYNYTRQAEACIEELGQLVREKSDD